MAGSRVLEVGNCSPDHYQLRMMLERHFDVAIDRVMFVDDALQKIRENQYDLVLFNRLIFEDQSEGLDLIRRARDDAQIEHAPPMMMISNFADAQKQAVETGCVPGFGKSSLFADATVQQLAEYLKRRGK